MLINDQKIIKAVIEYIFHTTVLKGNGWLSMNRPFDSRIQIDKRHNFIDLNLKYKYEPQTELGVFSFSKTHDTAIKKLETIIKGHEDILKKYLDYKSFEIDSNVIDLNKKEGVLYFNLIIYLNTFKISNINEDDFSDYRSEILYPPRISLFKKIINLIKKVL
jgi:hypothetical protein